MVELKTFKVSSITFENRLPNGSEIKLKNQFSYNVNYFETDNRCVGKIDYRISDEALQPFSVRVELEAMFTYDEGDRREDIHVESFDQIFPFLRQVIHATTSMSGIPGLIIPMAHIERDNIRINDNNARGSSPLN